MGPITEDEVVALIAGISGGSGSGEGDMKKSVYDPDSNVKNAGGIEAYFSTALATALTVDNDGYINLQKGEYKWL